MVNTSSGAPGRNRDIRLHLGPDLMAELLSSGEISAPREAAHYLMTVMRAAVGDRLLAFSGAHGEWRVEIAAGTKREARLRRIERTREPEPPPDLWLLFAPIKKARTDFIVEKACELGCRRVLPVLTERTQAERVKTDRLQAHAIEAAEQCGLVFAPEVAEPSPLSRVLDAWPAERWLHFCDETRNAPPLAEVAKPGPAAILIGPEGGFTPAEAERLRRTPFVVPGALGPRILRADTAAAAAIAIWQDAVGDLRARSGAGAFTKD